jgi:hypothetical protein
MLFLSNVNVRPPPQPPLRISSYVSMSSNDYPRWYWLILPNTAQESFFSGRVLASGHSKGNLISHLFLSVLRYEPVAIRTDLHYEINGFTSKKKPGQPNRFLFYEVKTRSLQLPKECSFRQNSKRCSIPPSEVISVVTDNGEYMVGVICSTHKALMSKHIKHLQQESQIPKGNIVFQEIKMVNTSCIKTYWKGQKN